MPRLRHIVEQILAKSREAEVAMTKGQSMAHVCRALSLTEQTYDRWHNGYGGLTVDLIKRLKDLDRENTRLQRAVASSSPRNARHPEMLHA